MGSEDEEERRRRGGGGIPAALGRMLSVMGVLAFVSFVVVLGIKATAQPGTKGSQISWLHVLTPLTLSLGFLFLYMMINFVMSRPYTGERGLSSRGGQQYYSLLQQLVVRAIDVRWVESYNQAVTLRAVLRFLMYGTLAGYALIVSSMPCNGCDVPYELFAFGILVTYVLRLVLIVYSGYYEYTRFRLMADELRLYQESLNGKRLFDHAVPDLHNYGAAFYSVVIGAGLWVAALAFALMGTAWINQGECESICGVTVHVYSWLLIGVYFAEGSAALSYFVSEYMRRTWHIEAIDRLVTNIEEVHSKNEMTSKT